MNSVTIKSDGVRTHVFNADGAEISNCISSLSIRADAAGIRADLELSFIGIDAVDLPSRMLGPAGKEVRRIEYVDGTVEEFGG